MTKKEIVKQISERIGLTQLKTKDIVQQTFDAIVDTLLEVGRIELRNFGVFEVKQRKARKARNPRTGEKVDVPPKNVVTFKPGKEMEERVRRMQNVPIMTDEEESADQVRNWPKDQSPFPRYYGCDLSIRQKSQLVVFYLQANRVTAILSGGGIAFGPAAAVRYRSRGRGLLGLELWLSRRAGGQQCGVYSCSRPWR